jgi:DNA-directed RNA polymerase specialized sigma24 family protein
MSDIHQRTSLGDVLYSKPAALVNERAWVRLVRAIAAGDQRALHELYDMAHRPVSALTMQITANRETTEEIVLDVFHDVWRCAAAYEAADSTVLAWIMNLARSRARNRQPVDGRDNERLAFGSADVEGPHNSLKVCLADRIAADTGQPPIAPPRETWVQPEWDEVAAGIQCKILATDQDRHRVSMLVRLAAGCAYPSHRHAGVEELHLLEGELWIDGRKLRPGDYHHAGPGSIDFRVWSEAGCTCVLATSTKDTLR